ncbi:T9SS type A sorting domain-containing protein, partial [candidate division WOR-3 bacterium]|nr:T9SS type A sorting domain-containing protein [candidate division WOR-3 bacterium]
SNIFNRKIEIELSLPCRTSVIFKVHDLSGRLVREDRFGNISEGIHRLYWEGKNDRGETVSPGVYFFSIEAGEGIYTDKIIFAD